MKNLNVYLPLFFILFLLSCKKDASVIAQNTTQRLSLFEAAAINKDFKKDFLVSPIENQQVPPHTKPSAEEIKIIQSSAQHNNLNYLDNYRYIKPVLDKWKSANEDKRYSMALQTVALRYLRHGFLLEGREKYESDVYQLLSLLIDEKNIDLDILADSYLFVKESLPTDINAKYQLYLINLHKEELNKIRLGLPSVQNSISTTEFPEKYKFISWEKDLERRHEACNYSAQLLPFLQSLGQE